MANNHDYDTVVFDYGGVLVHHQNEGDYAKMARISGVASERLSELCWLNRLEYDRGLLSGEAYWKEIGSWAGVQLTDQQISGLIEADSRSWMNFDEWMWEWVDELRSAGTQVALLSNMPPDLGALLRSETKRFEAFQHVTLSYEVHSVKPEPAIYEDCLKGIGTAPARTLFLDDRIANVRGAEALGIHAIQFTSRGDVMPRLRELQLAR